MVLNKTSTCSYIPLSRNGFLNYQVLGETRLRKIKVALMCYSSNGHPIMGHDISVLKRSYIANDLGTLTYVVR